MNRELVLENFEKLITDFKKEHNISITTSVFKSKGEVSISLSLMTKEQRSSVNNNFRRISERMGFPQSIIGMKFTHKDVNYTISDILVGNTKYPILGLASDGSGVKFTRDLIREILKDEHINRENNFKEILGDD